MNLKLLLDSCVWGGAVQELVGLGHDVDWSGTWPADPGDAAILAHARDEGRILVTLDKDFGEWPSCAVYRMQGSSVWLAFLRVSKPQHASRFWNAMARNSTPTL